MKNYKKITKTFIFCIILSSLFSCSSDDDSFGRQRIPLFSEDNLSLIHGDSEKKWKITEFINLYHDPNYHLEIELSCLNDDVYTFYSSQNEFSVDLGADKCFGTNDDGIFRADVEIFDGELLMLDTDESTTIALRFSRGYTNNSETATGISIRYFRLAELSENRMVFYTSGAEFVGEYKEALIFESF